MKKLVLMLTFFVCCFILYGCDASPRDNVHNTPQASSVVNESTESQVPDISIPVTTDYESGDIEYKVPSNWSMAVKDDKNYFYPPSGVLMVICTKDTTNISDSTEELYLTSIKEGVSEGSSNFMEISSDYIEIFDVKALDFIYFQDLNDVTYQTRAVFFMYNENLYQILLAQPDEISENTAFDEIISSIVFKDTNKSLDDIFSDIESEADKITDSMIEIKSGVLYDSIKSVNQDILLLESDDSLMLNIFLNSSTPAADSDLFFSLVEKVCTEADLESVYSKVSFALYVDKKYITLLSYSDYNNSDDYTSFKPLVIDDTYKDFINDLYYEYNNEHDIDKKYDDSINEIIDKYGLNK